MRKETVISVAVMVCIALAVGSVHAELVAHYTFDSVDGVTTPCAVSDNYATLGERVEIDTSGGVVGGALKLNGPGDPAVATRPIPGAATSNQFSFGTGARTITFWWRALIPNADLPSGTYISLGGGGTVAGGRFDIREVNLATQGYHQVRVEIQGGGNFSDSDPENFDDGQWHFVAVVVPEGATLGDVEWYVDGGTENLNTSTSTAVLNTLTSPLVMGASMITAQVARTPYGYLDDVRLYNTALTLEEIDEVFSLTSAKARDPNPENGAVINPLTWDKQLTWDGPLTKTDPDGDPNLVSFESFDIIYYEKATKDVTADDPNWLLGTAVTGVTSPLAYPLFSGPDYDRTFFWRVDTHVTWDSNDFTGTASLQSVVTGSNWRFRTLSAVPQIDQQPASIRVFPDVPNAVLTCQFFSAEPPVSVQWYKVGDPDVPLSTGGDLVITTTDDGIGNYVSTLEILTPVLADEGEYYCEIDNDTVVKSDVADLVLNLLLAQYDFDGTLAPTAGSLVDAPTGQGKTLNGLAEPNELLAANVAVTYDTGVNGVGQAVVLDPNAFVTFGTNGYPRAGALTGGLGRGLDQGTIMYWVKPAAASFTALTNYNDGTTTGFVTHFNAAGNARLHVRGEATNMGGPAASPDRPGWDALDGAWHLIAVTWAAGDVMRVYVDGQPVAANGNPPTPENYAAWQRGVLMGASRDGTYRDILSNYVGGVVDNLRIYNYRLDAESTAVFAEEYYNGTGILPCLNSNFVGSEYNHDNTGTSYCKVDLADFVKLASGWLTDGLWPLD